MTLGFSLLFRQPSPRPGSWKRDDVYDAVFALRMVIAVVLGLVCGVLQLEGLAIFLGYVSRRAASPVAHLGLPCMPISC